jgi:hypothetical protein
MFLQDVRSLSVDYVALFPRREDSSHFLTFTRKHDYWYQAGWHYSLHSRHTFRSSGHPTILAEVFCGFPQALQENSGIVL